MHGCTTVASVCVHTCLVPAWWTPSHCAVRHRMPSRQSHACRLSGNGGGMPQWGARQAVSVQAAHHPDRPPVVVCPSGACMDSGSYHGANPCGPMPIHVGACKPMWIHVDPCGGHHHMDPCQFAWINVDPHESTWIHACALFEMLRPIGSLAHK